MSMSVRWAVVALSLVLILAGCAQSRRQAFYQHLNQQIGVMTIAEAIQLAGVPTYERTLPSGETLLVWERYASSGYSVPAGPGVMHSSSRQRETWTATFGADGRLKAWTHTPMR